MNRREWIKAASSLVASLSLKPVFGSQAINGTPVFVPGTRHQVGLASEVKSLKGLGSGDYWLNLWHVEYISAGEPGAPPGCHVEVCGYYFSPPVSIVKDNLSSGPFRIKEISRRVSLVRRTPKDMAKKQPMYRVAPASSVMPDLEYSGNLIGFGAKIEPHPYIQVASDQVLS